MPRPTGRQRIGARRLGDRIVVDVDDAIEHGDGMRTVAASLSKSNTGLPSPSAVTWRARLIEPRLQTAVSSRR